MDKNIILLCFIALCFFNCKTISINQEFQTTTTQNLQLGSIGEQKDFILEQDYNHTALPNYQKPIKLQARSVVFNKASYKAFINAKSRQNQTVNINYIDSIENKPKYLKLDIADRVAILNTLNGKENKEVFQFLENKNEAHIVTGIALALNTNDINVIANADEVFLETSGIKNYVLNTYKNKELQQTIKFKDGVVFAYQTSNCCWKQNNKYQVEIVDLVESNDKCPSKSYQSVKRANKKINYYNF